ncbi:MAG TPA: HAD-IIIA family hydrolase [Candidatus Binataceae bacterium]|nr:HAD-IIIA family hydrolase [Candidatus Binataceae bacterium]
MSEAGNAALFFDLGGTLLKLDPSAELPVDSRGRITVELLPNVAETLRPIRDHLIFVVTNQSKIKRGRFTVGQVEDAIAELDRQLGDILTGYQICPHDDADRCACRKPRPGMITELTAMYGVDLAVSTMVGDQDVDEQAARAAGLRFVHARDFFGWKGVPT